jgi:hypothetical protein
MPYVKIETNRVLSETARQVIFKDASGFIASLLGKPVQYIMVSLSSGLPMIFNGETLAAAYIELKSIGLSYGECPWLSRELCDFVKEKLDIRPDRVYIEFSRLNGKMFGWNGRTF